MGGCASSKILTRSVSLKEEIQKRLQRRRTDSYKEIIISKNGTEQFVAVLCSSMSNTVATKTTIKEHESSTQASLQKEEVEEQQEPENSIETINIWELLAGLEDDNEPKREEIDEPLEIINTTKDESETSEAGKGFKRKMVAKELPAMKVPAFEFSRTGSLRDWLSQGGQVFSPGSYVTPRFGSSEQAPSGKKEEEVFDPNLVSQLEEAMEDMTAEEEKILKQIT